MGMPKNPESFNAFAPWKLDEIYAPPFLAVQRAEATSVFMWPIAITS